MLQQAVGYHEKEEERAKEDRKASHKLDSGSHESIARDAIYGFVRNGSCDKSDASLLLLLLLVEEKKEEATWVESCIERTLGRRSWCGCRFVFLRCGCWFSWIHARCNGIDKRNRPTRRKQQKKQCCGEEGSVSHCCCRNEHFGLRHTIDSSTQGLHTSVGFRLTESRLSSPPHL